MLNFFECIADTCQLSFPYSDHGIQRRTRRGQLIYIYRALRDSVYPSPVLIERHLSNLKGSPEVCKRTLTDAKPVDSGFLYPMKGTTKQHLAQP